MVIYRPRKSIMGGGLAEMTIVFFGLTLPLVLEGAPVPTGKLVGLGIFWAMGILLTVMPLGARLEVGEDYIKTWFWGFGTTPKIHSSDVQVIGYGNVFLGGLGFGKGINFRALSNGKSKAYSIGEIVYGTEAIAHARRVLESQMPK
jgi:hypothetical protein